MFDPVDPKQSLPLLEEGILQYWREEDTFKRSLKQRAVRTDDLLDQGNEKRKTKNESMFSFYDGPPFATGLPHYGHLLAGTIKDVIPRYQTMRGKYVERRFGWDCHGLPIENLIEEEQGLKSKRDIEELGVAKFNALCRASVQRYTKEWRETVERMGRWVDMDWDYRTMDPDYMESMWWGFQQLYKKNLIYEGHKAMHVCPRCVTPLSNFEVTQGYADITDQAVTVMFELEDSKDANGAKDQSERKTKNEKRKTFVLAWTTTPWTLPGNLFLAVHPDIEYVQFQLEDEGANYIASALFVANEKRETIRLRSGQARNEKRIYGKDLLGLRYKPLFPYFEKQYRDTAFRIVEGDFVTTDEGTGVVHIATGYGADDFEVGKREGTGVVQHVTMDGRFTDDVTDFAGLEVKPKDDPMRTDKKIVELLQRQGKVFSREKWKHSYPHCWRCESPLLNYATSSWFVKVEALKEKMLANNAKTAWVPAHIRDGRFGKWLEGARDWAISRSRFWGTPLPIWRLEGNGKLKIENGELSADIEVIGSRDELMAKSLLRFTKVTVLRHGESEGNTVPMYQGEMPGTDLTERGREQARVTGYGLRVTEHPVSIIYCSPLSRARKTAEIIAKAVGAKVIVDERLRELSFGDYEGKTVDFTDLSFVKARRAHKFETGRPESIYHLDTMETWESVRDRIQSFLNETLPKHRSEHIAIVTHADPLQNIRHFFSGHSRAQRDVAGEELFKLGHQPYPTFTKPYTFFWDHDREQQLDLHKDVVDDIVWGGPPSDSSVDVTLVRHGETEWNTGLRLQGHSDNPLNGNGKEQSKKVAKKLRSESFDVILTSDLKRAADTADIIAKEIGVKEVKKLPLLRERSFGEWEGKTRDELLEHYPPLHHPSGFALHHFTPGRGESLSEFLTRVQKAKDYLLEHYAGKRVLVVSHGGTMQALRAVIENLSYLDAITKRHNNAETVTLSINPSFHRIPEVLDCWFESGSMPYAQPHFPFENSTTNQRINESTNQRPSGFPADFIAEGLDQTRTWFYVLMVLSTALFDDTPFRNVVVNGIVLAEDGKKMSKRLKNYPDPLEVVGRHGADAIRFTLMSSPAVRAEDHRFSEKLVEESVRAVLLPLWNTYSFFVTYANAAGFDPVETRTHSTHPLDLWIRAEVQDLANRMTKELDNYDLSATCAELHETIDALTNWYVRLSRRRFAGHGSRDCRGGQAVGNAAEDQHAALATLYDVLLTLSQLLAPFCPFITEAIYVNLVSEEHGSVHLTDWPETRELSTRERILLEKTRLMRLIVSLGLSVRAEANVKVRQPLNQATVALSPALAGSVQLSDEDTRLLRQELNVKELAFADDPEKLAQTIVQVNARAVGPRLGARVQEMIKAGKEGEFSVKDDGTILILDEELGPEEASVVYRGKEGANVAARDGVVVSVNTEVSKELQLEGDARDLIRTVQRLRKEAGLSFTDRITLSVEGADDVLEKFGELVAEETRAQLGAVKGKGEKVEIGEREVGIVFEKV